MEASSKPTNTIVGCPFNSAPRRKDKTEQHHEATRHNHESVPAALGLDGDREILPSSGHRKSAPREGPRETPLQIQDGCACIWGGVGACTGGGEMPVVFSPPPAPSPFSGTNIREMERGRIPTSPLQSWAQLIPRRLSRGPGPGLRSGPRYLRFQPKAGASWAGCPWRGAAPPSSSRAT